MKEVDLLRARVGIKGEGRQGLFEIEFGEDSELYAKCKKIGVESLEQYYKWLATFFLGAVSVSRTSVWLKILMSTLLPTWILMNTKQSGGRWTIITRRITISRVLGKK